MPHRHPVKVRFYELDPYGHLNHSVYVQLFETGRVELLDEVGLGLHDLEAEGFRFVVTQIATRFRALPLWAGTPWSSRRKSSRSAVPRRGGDSAS
ncbi:MAG: hypothetical protein Ct9H300mP31_05380 [Acidimicrobiaceae bacterium]|nr:MAG: hypothetical protein Ct9H300mP31_05380 [Acidimicrobiaceae bacterium]